jgi:phospholipase/carboxylesterase
MDDQRIHQDQPVFTYGAALKNAQVAVILLHGRGSTAQAMLGLAAQLPQEKTAYLAPQAAHQTWYPNSGFIPIEANEPYVSSAFQTVVDILAHITDSGVAADKVVLGGFSQGACLAAEFAARHPQRYGGLFVLSGALMGPPDAAREYSGSLDGTRVFVAGSDHDSWVTEKQLRLTGQVLRALGGTVTVEVQPGTEHTIRQAEIAHVSNMISKALGDTIPHAVR